MVKTARLFCGVGATQNHLMAEKFLQKAAKKPLVHYRESR
jgi:hypothetical protein